MVRNSSPASRYSCKHSLSSRESDLRNPCQPTAYLCPKAEDGNRRKSVLQRNFNTAPQELPLSTQPPQELQLATAPRQEQPTPKIKKIAKLTMASLRPSR